MENYKIERIVVATDFSTSADEALQIAAEIASRHGAIIYLLHVIDHYYMVTNPMEMFSSIMNIRGELAEVSRTTLEQKAQEIQAVYGIEIRVKISVGAVVTGVLEEAYIRKASLIVIGTHGKSGYREFFMGSNAYKVLKDAHCPVMTIPESGYRRSFKKILFPVRAVPGAWDKYEFARTFIKQNEAEVYLLACATDLSNTEINELQRVIEILKIELEEDKIKYALDWTVHRPIAEGVLEKAKRINADLLIISDTLDKKIHEFFIGPYSQRIINHSTLPVLSVKI